MSMEVVDKSHKNNQVFNGTMRATSYRIQGGKVTQEDVVYISHEKDQRILAAVFDGNGGIGQDAIEKNLLQKLIAYSNQCIINGDLTEGVIKDGFQEINNALNKIERKNEYGDTVLPWQSAGSTAVVLFFLSQYNKFFISWCGDSEAIWSKHGELKSTMPVHHLQERSGPYSFYRSFGNFAANNPEQSKFVEQSGCQMTAEPDILAIDANNTEWILMATDGLWTYTSKQEVFNFVKNLLKKRNKYLVSLKPILDSDLDLHEKQTLIKERYSDQEIVKKVIILSILNDVKHNLVEKWFQFFFKEYIKIIFPAFRGKNVTKKSYIRSLKWKVIELMNFMQKVQCCLDDFPFIVFSECLNVKDYMDLSYPYDEACIREMLVAGERFTPEFSSADRILEHEFPNDYNFDSKKTKTTLNNMNDIIRYLYCNLDDGTLADRLTKVFALDFETLKKVESDHLFCYRQRCFLSDLKNNFLKIQSLIDSQKSGYVPYWSTDYLNQQINNIQSFASDNTAIVFLNKEKNEQDVLVNEHKKKELKASVDKAIPEVEQSSMQPEKNPIIGLSASEVKKDDVLDKDTTLVVAGNPDTQRADDNKLQVIQGIPQSLSIDLSETQQNINKNKSSKIDVDSDHDKEPQESRFSIFCSYIASFFSSFWQFFANFLL